MASTVGGAFGLASGLITRELGYDDDVDGTLRQVVEAETGTTLVDENYEGMAGSAIVWWCDDDGDVDDLIGLLMDAQANLDDAGLIWVLTPKARTASTVPAAEVEEAAQAAGIHATSVASIGRHWSDVGVSSRGC